MKALIIRPGALGDTLMLLPALLDLTGKATITFVGRQPGLGILKNYVHSAMDLEGLGWHRLFTERKDIHGLPVPETDLVVAFFADRDGTIRNNLNRHLPHTPAYLFPSFPSEQEQIHVARYLAGCLRSAGLPVDPDRSIKAFLTGGLPQKASAPSRQDKIVFHPGSGDPRKNHPPDLWLDLIGRLGQAIDFQVAGSIILLGPAEESIVPLFQKGLRPARADIIFSPDSDTLVEILREAILYVGQDSGITHLAAMLGTPTIALFKETNEHQWRPLGPHVKVILEKEAGPALINNVLQASVSLYSLLTTNH
ncbi:MAG: glycosyltransferase family 9 protein [Pseudomonadota bacterium]